MQNFEMENVFNMGAGAPAQPSFEEGTSNKSEDSLKKECMKRLQAEITANPELEKELSSASGTLRVKNTLGFSDKGSLIRDMQAPKDEKGKYPIRTVSELVGYLIENIGNAPIEYETNECKLDKNTGLFTVNKVTKVLAPGASVAITRRDLTKLASEAKFSFKLANGKMVASSAMKNINREDPEAVLNACYFTFDKIEGQESVTVHDDKIKIQIANKNGDTWKVKPEFESVFGYLNNPVTKPTREPRAKANKPKANELLAAYVRDITK